jgi:hypothetical protein
MWNQGGILHLLDLWTASTECSEVVSSGCADNTVKTSFGRWSLQIWKVFVVTCIRRTTNESTERTHNRRRHANKVVFII